MGKTDLKKPAQIAKNPRGQSKFAKAGKNISKKDFEVQLRKKKAKQAREKASKVDKAKDIIKNKSHNEKQDRNDLIADEEEDEHEGEVFDKEGYYELAKDEEIDENDEELLKKFGGPSMGDDGKEEAGDDGMVNFADIVMKKLENAQVMNAGKKGTAPGVFSSEGKTIDMLTLIRSGFYHGPKSYLGLQTDCQDHENILNWQTS
jgi:hypothetical protein